MITDQEINEIEKMFPDALGDCPYCLDDVNLTFLVAFKIGTNEKALYFHINSANGISREIWQFAGSWKQINSSFVESRDF